MSNLSRATACMHGLRTYVQCGICNSLSIHVCTPIRSIRYRGKCWMLKVWSCNSSGVYRGKLHGDTPFSDMNKWLCKQESRHKIVYWKYGTSSIVHACYMTFLFNIDKINALEVVYCLECRESSGAACTQWCRAWIELKSVITIKSECRESSGAACTQWCSAWSQPNWVKISNNN